MTCLSTGPESCPLCPILACPEAEIQKLTPCPSGKAVLALFRDPLLPAPVLVCQGFLQIWVFMAEELGVTAHELRGFPGGSAIKNQPANAGDSGSVPGLRRSPGERNGNPLQYSFLENSMDRGAWWATVPGITESQNLQLNNNNVSRVNENTCSKIIHGRNQHSIIKQLSST